MVRSFIAASFVAGCLLYGGGDIAKPVEPSVNVPSASSWQSDGAYNGALKFGTLGIGLDVSRAINQNVGLRFNVNGLRYNRTETLDDIDYDATLTLLTVGLLADYYPFENAFRISAGAYYNGNKLEGTARPSATQTINVGDNTYTGAEIGRLDAAVDFQKFAPYVGVGWGSDSRQSGWGFTFDLGVMYQGSPNVAASAAINPSLPEPLRQQIINDVEKERQNIADEVKNYKWYPVVMIGINYTF